MFLDIRTRMYGRAGFDQTHMLSINYLYDFPNMGGSNMLTRGVLNGWQFSGITTLASGLPLPINLSTTDNADITGGGDPVRVNLVGPPTRGHGDRSFDRWFNTQAFGRPAQGTFGNAAKDLFRGPGLNNWDLTLMKKFNLGSEQRYLQFRSEFYNAFNHTQFQSVDNTARFDETGKQVNDRFGQVVSTRLPRVIQLGRRLRFVLEKPPVRLTRRCPISEACFRASCQRSTRAVARRRIGDPIHSVGTPRFRVTLTVQHFSLDESEQNVQKSGDHRRGRQDGASSRSENRLSGRLRRTHVRKQSGSRTPVA
jgi:hypothetical protein